MSTNYPLHRAQFLSSDDKVKGVRRRSRNNRVLYRDGVAIAALVGGEVQWIEQMEAGPARAAAENALIRRPIGSALLAYLR
jgi:hypothetical protein